MKRHLQNLQRLSLKFQARYGKDDDLVKKLELETKTIQALETSQSGLWHLKRRTQEMSTPFAARQ